MISSKIGVVLVLAVFLILLSGCGENTRMPPKNIECISTIECIPCGSSCISSDMGKYVKCLPPEEGIACVCSENQCEAS